MHYILDMRASSIDVLLEVTPMDVSRGPALMAGLALEGSLVVIAHHRLLLATVAR